MKMQSISLFLDITKSADFWWKNADVSKAQSKPNLQTQLEFAVEWIRAVRNKAKIIFSSKNHLHYCNCFNKIKSEFFVFEWCYPTQAAVQMK